MKEQYDVSYSDQEPTVALSTVIWFAAAISGGALLASFVAPALAPGLLRSILGEAPKAYWYLSRASAFVAYGLLWLSMVFGLLITNKLAKAWPGGPAAFDLHQFASLLGLGFGLFHALILLGDGYIGYSLADVLIPFAGASYRPLWVGLGQVGFYVMALVSLTFYMRNLITQRGWRLVHFLSFAVFAVTAVHGITSGTDTAESWARWIYWLSGGSVLFLTVYRVLSAKLLARPARTLRAGG
jgi:predicted ferric reductase